MLQGEKACGDCGIQNVFCRMNFGRRILFSVNLLSLCALGLSSTVIFKCSYDVFVWRREIYCGDDNNLNVLCRLKCERRLFLLESFIDCLGTRFTYFG